MSGQDFDPWWTRVACRELALAPLFDEPRNEPRLAERVAAAKRHCEVCPVVDVCFAEAVKHHDSGVRGGVMLVNGKPSESVRQFGRQLSPCGTYAAAARHHRNKEKLDAACRLAWNDAKNEQYARRQAEKREAS